MTQEALRLEILTLIIDAFEVLRQIDSLVEKTATLADRLLKRSDRQTLGFKLLDLWKRCTEHTVCEIFLRMEKSLSDSQEEMEILLRFACRIVEEHSDWSNFITFFNHFIKTHCNEEMENWLSMKQYRQLVGEEEDIVTPISQISILGEEEENPF